MNREEFETLLGSLAAQYADACCEEIEALAAEVDSTRAAKENETCTLGDAYGLGKITGRNAELRKTQLQQALLQAEQHQQLISLRDIAVLARKRASMVRVGIEYEMKLWRSWLASQGGD